MKVIIVLLFLRGLLLISYRILVWVIDSGGTQEKRKRKAEPRLSTHFEGLMEVSGSLCEWNG